jgi:hypothetical protein
MSTAVIVGFAGTSGWGGSVGLPLSKQERFKRRHRAASAAIVPLPFLISILILEKVPHHAATGLISQ